DHSAHTDIRQRKSLRQVAEPSGFDHRFFVNLAVEFRDRAVNLVGARVDVLDLSLIPIEGNLDVSVLPSLLGQNLDAGEVEFPSLIFVPLYFPVQVDGGGARRLRLRGHLEILRGERRPGIPRPGHQRKANEGDEDKTGANERHRISPNPKHPDGSPSQARPTGPASFRVRTPRPLKQRVRLSQLTDEYMRKPMAVKTQLVALRVCYSSYFFIKWRNER